jgi:hypothetical protein
MKNYSHKAIEESVSIGILASALLDEIKYIHRPLFEYIEKQNYEITPDHFTTIRILMPLIEISSKIEFQGRVPEMLKKLKVPKPEIIWQMFRHGLVHYVRPFYAVVDGERIGWAVPQYPCNHYETTHAVGVYAPKLLNDLEEYLKTFRYSTNQINIQTGIELTKSN